MNRRTYIIAIAIVLGFCLSNRTAMIGPPGGIIFAKLKGPVLMTSVVNNAGYNGEGESHAWTILYVITVGDASIQSAKRNGSKNPELVRLTHADYEWVHFLGCGKYKLKVYFFDPNKE